jgi:paraquat-inducible protein B
VSERKTSVLVGAFIVGALVIATAGALFFAGGGLGGARTSVVMVFDGSLRGLNVGAPVALRGVTVGQVKDIDMILNVDKGDVSLVVVAEIDESGIKFAGASNEHIGKELIARGLRAQLNMQSLLTGLLYVELDFHPDTEALTVALDAPYPQIPTIPTDLERLRQSLDSIDYASIVDNMDRIARGLDTLVNNPDMQALPSALRSSLAAVEGAGRELTATLDENSRALGELIGEASTTVSLLNTELPALTASMDSSLESLDQALMAAAESLAQIERASAPDSAPRRQLTMALQDLSLAARALRSLARSLDEHPEALLRGRTE